MESTRHKINSQPNTHTLTHHFVQIKPNPKQIPAKKSIKSYLHDNTETIDGNGHQIEGGRVEAENPAHHHQFADRIVGQPLHGERPGNLQRHGEKGHQQVADGQAD